LNEKKITLKDIAKLVNLSPSTVSLAINNKPGLSKDTRERILRVAQAKQAVWVSERIIPKY